MTLAPKDRPDWAAAGWDWTGGGDDRLRIPRPAPGDYTLVAVAELKAVQAALAKAHASLAEKGALEELKPPLHPMCKSEITPEVEIQPVDPGIMGQAFNKLSAELLVLQEQRVKDRADLWATMFRAFAAGALVAWILRDVWSRF